MLSRESVCVDVNLKTHPQSLYPLLLLVLALLVQALVNRNKGLESTHSKDVWLGLP